jgi:hypothetical protein
VFTCALALGIGACSSSGGGRSARSTTPAPPTTTVETPTALATQAYVWGSPLVITERTLQTFARLVGVNRIFSQAQLSNASSRLVVAPNVDTLYSIAVIDLRGGPLVLHVPPSASGASKYWVYQFIDAWTDSFAYLGTRATRGAGGTWVITPPGYRGAVPQEAHRINAPTPQVFLLGRWLVATPADVPRVATALRTITLQPLDARQPTPTLGAPAGTPQTVAQAGASFFDELGDALAINPPATAADREALLRFSGVGVGPGTHPSRGAQQTTLAGAVAAGARQVLGASRNRPTAKSGWATRFDVGTYTDPLIRAQVAQAGWGANVPAEAVYAQARVDTTASRLDGHDTYRMHFAAGQAPPVNAFWSLTLYGPDHFLVANPMQRFAISTRTPSFHVAADGSFDIWISNRPPASGNSNWLPAPNGPFSLTLRMYLPRPAVTDGTYQLPGVGRAGG